MITEKDRRYLNAPFKIRILHQGPVAELPLEELVNRRVQQGFQLNVQVAEVLEHLVLACILQIRLLAIWAYGVRDVPIADLDGEIILRALVAAAMHALQHGYHLKFRKYIITLK